MNIFLGKETFRWENLLPIALYFLLVMVRLFGLLFPRYVQEKLSLGELWSTVDVPMLQVR